MYLVKCATNDAGGLPGGRSQGFGLPAPAPGAVLLLVPDAVSQGLGLAGLPKHTMKEAVSHCTGKWF